MKHSPVILPVLLVTLAAAENGRPIPVTPENFIRAESDLYMSAVVQKGGFGRFDKVRDLAPVERQTSTHANRDTLYAAAVFDLDAGPVTITLPDPGKRFMSMQVITEDQYTPMVVYRPTPGQEVRNADVLQAAGAAVHAETLEEVETAVERWLTDPAARDRARASAAKLARPHAADTIAEFVLEAARTHAASGRE